MEKYVIALNGSVFIYFFLMTADLALLGTYGALIKPVEVIYWTIASNWIKFFLILLPWAGALRQGIFRQMNLGLGALRHASGGNWIKNLLQTLMLGVVLLLAVDFISILNNLLLQFLQIKMPENLVVNLFKQGTPNIKYTMAFLALVTAPFCEEFFFRNILFKFIRDVCCSQLNPKFSDRRRRTWIAALATSLVFAVIHFNFYGVIPLFCLGLLFQFLFIRTKSLWPSIIIHSLNNLQALLLTSL